MSEIYCEVCDYDLVEMKLVKESHMVGNIVHQWWKCPDCGGEIDRDYELVLYVNVYSVQRMYGGPQEGGSTLR